MFGVFAFACDNRKAESVAEAPQTPDSAEAKRAEGDPSPQAPANQAPVAAGARASVGKPAPSFKLKNLEGSEVSLADYRGKIVVLEWFNPECPFVKASHTKGSLKKLAEQHHGKSDVAWLAVNSGGEGRQGFGLETNREAATRWSLPHPVLLDDTGSVGKAYGATNTPHMFIVDRQGILVYKGAIDNSPDGEGGAAPDGKLVNYVSRALGELEAGKAVSVPETKAYGCSVKYAG